MLILNRPMPFHQMQRDLDEFFNAVFTDASRFVPTPAFVPSPVAGPPMNVWEENDCFRIEAELPGYTMHDIEVTVLNDEVTTKGVRRMPDQDGATYLRRERRPGSFTRTWTFPAEIDADRVEATLRDGVLLLTLPKSPTALPRKIEVKASKA